MTAALMLSVKLSLMAMLGLLGLSWVTQVVTGSRRLRDLLALSFALRALLGVMLYQISSLGWPILPSLQIGDGFWRFGMDSYVYDYYGRLIAEAWTYGTELPDPQLGFEYFAFVASLYKALGAHPLYAIVANALLAASLGLFAYAIGRRLFGERSAFMGAVAVSFWPSSFLWSAQLLKDAFCWFFLFTVLWLIVSLLPRARPDSSSRSHGQMGQMGRCLLLACALIVLTRVRFYLGSALSLAAIAVLAPASVSALMRRAPQRSLRYGALMAMIVCSTVVGRSLNTIKLFSPRHPEEAHRKLAMEYWRQGGLEQAHEEFRRIAVLNPHDAQAQLGMATLLFQQDNPSEAAKAYRNYLAVEEPEKRMDAGHKIAQIFLEYGNQQLKANDPGSAAGPYQQAILFDPRFGRAHLNLAIAMAQEGKLDIAISVLEEGVRRVQTAEERAELQVLLDKFLKEQEVERTVEIILGLRKDMRLMDEEGQRSTQAIIEQLTADPNVGAAMAQRGLLREVSHARLSELLRSLARLESSAVPAMTANQIFFSLSLKPQQETGKLPSHAFAGDELPIKEQAERLMREGRPEMLATARKGFVAAGGHALMDAQARIATPGEMLAYLPRGLAIGLLAPFPWQWFDRAGSTGIMRLFAGMEMLLLYALLPAMVWGIVEIIRRRHIGGLVIVAFAALTWVAMAVVIANIGTLFRLRLLFLWPLLIVAFADEPLERYTRFLRRFSHGGAARPPSSAQGGRAAAGEAMAERELEGVT